MDPKLISDIKDIKRRLERLETIERPITSVGARVYNSAAISSNNATLTALTFDTERYDTDGLHSTSSNTGRLTCTRAGKHLIVVNLEFASNATGYRVVHIRLNGTTYIAVDSKMAVNGNATWFSTATIYDLAVGDYVEVVVYQTSGGALNVSAAGNYTPEFMIQRQP